jgi:hypothetical protein
VINLNTLLSFAENNLDVLFNPFGELDCLLYYNVIAPSLQKYLSEKPLATFTWLPKADIPYIVHRGSKLEPLTVQELTEHVTTDFLRLRADTADKSDVSDQISDIQSKIWSYFNPRKYIELHYPPNDEGKNNDLERIYFDIDRGEGASAPQAQKTASLLIQEIEADDELADLLSFNKPFCYWTGNSFHVYLFLEDSISHSAYNDHFRLQSKKPDNSFTGRWAQIINDEVDFKVKAGHERSSETIIIDPSQSPSGKLSRVPLGALHMADGKTIDGVSVPVTRDLLANQDLTDDLLELHPVDIIENLDEFTQRLPKQFR